MMRKIWMPFLLVVVLLTACSGGPSNEEAKEIIYGVYFKDATIVDKSQCEITPSIEEEGYTNVWLVRYRFDGSFEEYGMTLAKVDGAWQLHSTMDSCPSW